MAPELLFVAAVAVAAGLVAGAQGDGAAIPSCAAAGTWFDGSTGAVIAGPAAVEALAAASVVLLGEGHDDADHHRWQVHTVAAIHGRDPNLALGFEALPRSARPLLESWVEGRMSETDLLAGTRWDEVWGYDPQLSLPLLHFARMHRTPAIGLNVPRSLVRRVSREGWDAVPAAEREGIGDPAPPRDAYLEHLLDAYRQHRSADDPPVQPTDPAFRRFVAAQQVWDRAMAEAIAEETRRTGRRMVAMVGRGHAEFGHGIPAQLRDLGIRDVVVALPWPADVACPTAGGEEAGVADLLFVVPAPVAPVAPGPR
jgi:uncharacterized iron-regulated protein